MSIKTFSLILVLIWCTLSCTKRQIKNQCCSNPATEIVFDSGYVAIPNIFVPNGDGVYDVLQTNVIGYSSFDLRIKCRKNGKSIFHTYDPNMWWDGSNNGKTKEGLYYYEYSVTSLSGATITGEGEVCLVLTTSDHCISNGQNCKAQTNYNGSEFVGPVDEIVFGCN